MKISLKNKLALISLIGMILTFPASNRYVLDIIEELYREINIYGGWVFVAFAAYLVGYIIHNMWRSREVVNTKPTSKKQPKVAYIET